MGYNVICISSTDGSGAQEIGRAVARAVGFRYIDEEIVSNAAAEAGVQKEVIEDVERRKTAIGKILDRLSAVGAAADPQLAASVDAQVNAVAIGMAIPHQATKRSSEEFRGLIRSAIDEIMIRGNVVIHAHGASQSLAGRDGVLRVLITGSPRVRTARLIEGGMEAGDAASAVKKGDAARADYLKRFYAMEAEEPTDYDLVFNTDNLSAEEVSSLIAALGEPVGAAAAV